jgi:hypothetical protein
MTVHDSCQPFDIPVINRNPAIKRNRNVQPGAPPNRRDDPLPPHNPRLAKPHSSCRANKCVRDVNSRALDGHNERFELKVTDLYVAVKTRDCGRNVTVRDGRVGAEEPLAALGRGGEVRVGGGCRPSLARRWSR